MSTKLSKNFTLEEFLQSETALRHGIYMTPSEEVKENLTALVNDVLQPLRDGLGAPLVVTSGYRPLALNRLLGSKDTSAHVEGRAADIKVIGVSPLEVAKFLEEHLLAMCDQIINEFDVWVHVAISKNPRSQTLTARKVGKVTAYSAGLV